ncbi:MAG TPA: hypothetical protein VE133_12745 [Candidatus Sulfotelmatobacter sp.]|jgi:Spy/CpxP family protein refolding chaperone|nr:hypothetical protein [Candidatus Sulfotelmatobacter sp.]
MKTLKKFCLLAVCLLAIGAVAQQNPPAQGGGDNQGGGQRRMPSVEDQVKNMTEKLNLNTDQQAKVKTILEDARSQMMKLMQDDTLSREDKRTKAGGIREAANGKIREALNDDQKKKFDDMQKEMQERRQRQQGGDSNPK